MGIISALGSLFLMIIGLWKFFARKNRERRKNAEDAQKLVQEGTDENNPSKVVAGFNRINRL
jgi:hypothetical protein